jgi:hypothetical protein
MLTSVSGSRYTAITFCFVFARRFGVDGHGNSFIISKVSLIGTRAVERNKYAKICNWLRIARRMTYCVLCIMHFTIDNIKTRTSAQEMHELI